MAPWRKLVFSALGICLGVSASVFGAAPQLTFEADVRPILKTHCFHCHGEGEKLKGDIDVRLRHFMVAAKTDDGPVLTPGKPNASALVKLIKSGEMPKGEKKLSDKDIATIEAWVRAGAPTLGPEPKELKKGFQITEVERRFWAFQPIARPPVPRAKNSERARTPIDSFLLAKLREQKLDFAPEADRVTLIRRVYFDLLGVPPTPEAVDEFMRDEAPDAYERLVDRALESPAYGERWGRHWLDAAGYADSNGFAEADSNRPHAWRYRDYVIRSLNADKPWNEFIVEQLAGDELAGATRDNAAAKAVDPRARELLAATGFLQMAPDGTGDDAGDQKLARNQTIAETVKIVSTSLLGLSVGCAQCHDHRYDPISQVDYYRLRAVFDPALDWNDWRPPSQRLVSLYAPEDRAKAEGIEAEARKVDEEANKLRGELLEKVFEKELAKLPDDIRETVKVARNTARDKRTPEQVALLKKNPSADVQGALDLYDPEANKKVTAKLEEAGKVRATKPKEPFVFAITERVGKTPESVLFNRGDHEQPRQKVEPGDLEILQTRAQLSFEKPPGLETSGRRLAYAKWLASDAHPLTARVLVNRFWLNYFGRGLVNSPGDFGKQGELPSHPELLDWLASEFVAGGWKLKLLHRLMMTSTAYRQSSRNDASLRVDPDNRLYGRMKLRRIDAETLRDSVLAVSGKINGQQFGPPLPIARDDAGRVLTGEQKTNGNGDPVLVEPIGERAFRRTVYSEVKRSLPLTTLEVFDEPVMSPNCVQRETSTAAPQALLMLNDTFIAQQAQFFAERLMAENPGDLRAQLARAWKLAYNVPPTDKEITSSLLYLAEQTERIRPRVVPPAKDKPARDPQILALSSLCQALLSANRFLYVE
jgi:hypothetical protein